MALQGNELIWIGVLLVLLFGAASIPKLAKALGRAKGEFNKARGEMDAEARKAAGEPSGGTSEEQVRRTARELGIPESGLSLDEVKRRLNEKLA